MVICEDNKCFGCAACHDICPSGAIVFEDTGGFWRPRVDKDKCIGCNKCLDVCPALSENIRSSVPNRSKPEICYAAWSNEDNIHYNSASGGIATELENNVIKKGGYAAGVVFDNERIYAKHILTNNAKELPRLAKSKYVLSNKSGIYKEVAERLSAGAIVLFTGVGCEINALYNYCNAKEICTEKLYTIDLLCRGGSSSRCLREHTDYVRKNRRISDVTFRGGKYDCSYAVWGENGNLLYRSFQFDDAYFRLFMKHVLFQKNCFCCPFANTERTGDITLADFWGLDERIASRNSIQGVNLVLVNSNKGKELLEEIRENITLIERPISEAINGNETLREATLEPEEYEELWKQITVNGFRRSIKKIYGYSERKDYYKYKFKTLKHLLKERISGS